MASAEYQREWVKNNHERKLQYQRNWRMRHPEKVKAQNTRRGNKRKEEYRRLKCAPCKDCGIQYNPWVMQWDHLRDKKFTISHRSNSVTPELLEEIKKCDLVCANCHADRTHNRQLALT